VVDVPNPTVEEFVALLELQERGPNVFTGAPAPAANAAQPTRMYGGHLLAQVLAAASVTVPPPWTCHALHADFVRAAKAGRPLDYAVCTVRDGRSGRLQRVVAVQDGEPTCELTASFAVDTDGPDLQLPMSETAAADAFPSDVPAPTAGERSTFGPVELVLVDARGATSAAPEFGVCRTWARIAGRIDDGPTLHRCALAFASDLAAVEPSMRACRIPPGDPEVQVASLNHGMWFHRRFRFDEWLLFVFDCVSLAAGRGLNRGYIYARSGALIASVVQETMLRPRREIA
jgi:acyl-CoA thioesterase-2